MTRASFIPSKLIRELHSNTRLKKKYVQQRASDVNRLINVFTRNNYKQDMVFSSIRGRSASRIIKWILSDEPYTEEDILACVDKRCKASREDILLAVEGIAFTETEKGRLRIIQKNIDHYDSLIKELDKQIEQLTSSFQEEIKLLLTMPGINLESARYLLAELGNKMDQFPTASKLCKWVGVAPGSNESAGKKFSVHVTKGGTYLKPVLVQCVWAAVRSKTDPYFKVKFEAIKARQGTKRTFIAIARKMLVCIWYMLKYKTAWKPKDVDEQSRPLTISARAASNKMKSAMAELISLGKDKEELATEIVTILQSLT